MKLTGRQLRTLIREALQSRQFSFDRKLSTEVFNAMMSSKFWSFPHQEADVELVDEHTFSTHAIEVLMDALNNASKSVKSDVYFILSVTDDEMYTLEPDDKFGGYPNNWLMRGQYRGPEKGKHIVWLEFRPYSEDYQLRDLDPQELTKIILRTINHELVHYYQLKKQAVSKGISEEEAWEELLCDPNQIPITDPVAWENRCGRKPPKKSDDKSDRADYISLHNEIDAFAFEAAEELLDKHTAEEAMRLLRTGASSASKIIKDYTTFLKDDPASLQRFLKKVYGNVEDMSVSSVE